MLLLFFSCFNLWKVFMTSFQVWFGAACCGGQATCIVIRCNLLILRFGKQVEHSCNSTIPCLESCGFLYLICSSFLFSTAQILNVWSTLGLERASGTSAQWRVVLLASGLAVFEEETCGVSEGEVGQEDKPNGGTRGFRVFIFVNLPNMFFWVITRYFLPEPFVRAPLHATKRTEPCRVLPEVMMCQGRRAQQRPSFSHPAAVEWAKTFVWTVKRNLEECFFVCLVGWLDGSESSSSTFKSGSKAQGLGFVSDHYGE